MHTDYILPGQFLHVGGIEDQIVSGRYIYAPDLLQMNSLKPPPMARSTLPGPLTSLVAALARVPVGISGHSIRKLSAGGD